MPDSAKLLNKSLHQREFCRSFNKEGNFLWQGDTPLLVLTGSEEVEVAQPSEFELLEYLW